MSLDSLKPLEELANGQTVSLSFVDTMTGESVIKKVRKKDDKNYIVGEYAVDPELTFENEKNNSLQYTSSGKEVFFRVLSQQFTESSYTFQSCMRDKNVNYLLKHYSKELLKIDARELTTLNYYEQNGRYGTLLHKAIDPRNGQGRFY